MSESPIELRGKGGGVVFQGTQSPGGGSQPGAGRTLKFPFDFSMAAALAVGVPVWTPAVGDWLLDAWFENDDPGWTADGDELPKADIGVVAAGAWDTGQGLIGRFVSAVDLSSVIWTLGTSLAVNNSGGAASMSIAAAQATAQSTGSNAMTPQTRFRTTDPLRLVVSGDGSPSGNAFDGSAGAASLFITVCTP